MSEGKREFTRRSERIEELVSRIENCGDPALRAVAKELLQAVLELHAAALEEMMDAIGALPEGEGALREISRNVLVSSVLSLHGIHPVPVEARVTEAIEEARPYLKSHGGDVELASVEDGIVHVRLQRSSGNGADSEEKLKQAVETAIYEAAPEVAAVLPEKLPVRSRGNLLTMDEIRLPEEKSGGSERLRTPE
jgi:Fe-S cluster biogenesis protein NfuA